MTNISNENSINNHSTKNRIVDPNLFFDSLFEYNSDMVIFMDIYGVIAKANMGFYQTLGYTEAECELTPLEQYLPSGEVSNYKNLFSMSLSGKTQYAYMTLLNKDSKKVFINLNLIPAKSEDRVIGVFGILKDITYVKKSLEELAESEQKFTSIVEESLIGVYIVKEDGNVSYANKKFYEILGLSNKKTELNFKDFIYPEDLAGLLSLGKSLEVNGEGITHTFRVISKDGTVLDIESHSAIIVLHGKPHMVASLQDITERKKAAELNEYLANHDFLTGLPNQRAFYQLLEQQLVINKTLNQHLTVMLLDLDRFKYINDSLGHPIGDKLLKKVAKRLGVSLGQDDVLVRIGGDEFAIVIPNASGNTDKVIDYAKTLIEALEAPFFVDEYELYITASIGISTSPNDGEDFETLIKYADSALYKAKAKGKNTYQIFTPSMNTETYKLFTLESDLRKALELDQFELYYQPQISSISHQIIGVEALIRWNHPEWGLVTPEEFIPLAEETGMIIEIGKWIKEAACTQNKVWQDAGLPAIPVSVNLSAHRFLDKKLLVNIRNILKETNLDPKYFQVEILETFILENEEVVFSVLDELKSMGIKVLLDDFGTGYSSLSYLKRFNGRIDCLKIDRSFINDLSREDDEGSNFLTKTIIEIANHMKMEVVAEGVDTVEQLDLLKEYNCNYIQGYLFSKPVPAAEFATLLKKGKIDIQSDRNDSKVIDNRRKFFRINLDFPLRAAMTLVQIYDKKLDLGKTEVLVEDIGLGGLRFLSDIRLPVHHGLVLEFETTILGENVKMYGTIVWMDELRSNIYQYGVEFSIDESERLDLAQLFNKLAILLRKNPIAPDCSFVQENPYTFFNQKSKKSKPIK